MMVQSGTRVQAMDTGAWQSTAVEVPIGPAAVADVADVPEQEDHQPAGGPDRGAIAALVKAAAAGDQHAWNGLVDKFASTVWAIARGYRLNAADAADVSQTTWLRLVENLNRIEQPERVGAWLATTARREALRVLRLAGRQIPNGDDFEVLPDLATSVAPDRGLLAGERDRLVTELVEQLPVRSQLLLRLLSADSPLSYRDISEALSMPIGSIGPTRARALEQLRRLALRAGFQLEDGFA
jgi:RNA polymerase sigma factor (sigma-70 family)